MCGEYALWERAVYSLLRKNSFDVLSRKKCRKNDEEKEREVSIDLLNEIKRLLNDIFYILRLSSALLCSFSFAQNAIKITELENSSLSAETFIGTDLP